MIFDTVDQIYCIVYKPYKEERYDDLCKEIDRLNLKVKIMEFDKDNDLSGLESTTKNYCRVFEDALYNHYNKIMVIEDDCRFLKNVSILQEFNTIPANADIIYCDYHCGYCDNPSQSKELMNRIASCDDLYYKLYPSDVIYLTTCNIYSRRAVLHMLLNYEYMHMNIDHYFLNHVMFIDKDCFNILNRYVTCVNLCIQKEYSHAASKHHTTYYDQYKLQGVDLNDYQL